MKIINLLDYKPLGQLLEEAGLIKSEQLKVALAEQKEFYPALKIGEILSLNGWLKPETSDFFAEQIKKNKCNDNIYIGEFLYQAGLLTAQEIDYLLLEQRKTGIQFTSIAVDKGLIKSETMNFFCRYFVPKTKHFEVGRASN